MGERYQYPAQTEPVLDESQRPETVLPDKYWRQPSEPLHALPRSNAALVSGGVLVEFSVPAPVAPEIGWFAVPAGPGPPPTTSPQLAATELVLDEGQRPEASTLDKWWRPASEPRWETLPLVQEGYLSRPILDPEEFPDFIANMSRWWQPASEPRWETLPLVAEGFIARPLPDPEEFVETAILSRWWQPASIPKWLPPKLVSEGYVSFQLDEGQQPEATTVDRWWRQASEPRWAKQPLVQEGRFNLDLDEAQRPETILLDKWFAPPPIPIGLLPSQNVGGSVRPEVVEAPAVLFDWHQLRAEIVRRRTWTVPEPYFTLELDEGQRPEIILLDKWFVQATDPMRLAIPVESGASILVPLVVLPIDWFLYLPDPIRLLRSVAEGTLVLPQLITEIPTFDWYVLSAEIVRRALQNIYTFVELPGLPKAPEFDSWWTQQYNPLPRRSRFFFVPFLDVSAPIGIPAAFVFRACQALWSIIRPDSWESAVAPSGFVAPSDALPEPSGYVAPTPYRAAASGYVKKEGGTTLWDIEP